MKRFILVLSIALTLSAVYADTFDKPIIYQNDETLNVNIPDETKENVEQTKPKLRNHGFVWQNSISPVNGLIYQSGKIIDPTPYRNYR